MFACLCIWLLNFLRLKSNLAVTDFENFPCYQPCPGSWAWLDVLVAEHSPRHILVAERGTGTTSKRQLLQLQVAGSCNPVTRVENSSHESSKTHSWQRVQKPATMCMCTQHPGQEWPQRPSYISKSSENCNSSSMELESKNSWNLHDMLWSSAAGYFMWPLGHRLWPFLQLHHWIIGVP